MITETPYAYTLHHAQRSAARVADLVGSHAPQQQGGLVVVHGPMASGKTLFIVSLAQKLTGLAIPHAIACPKLDRAELIPGKVISRQGVEAQAQAYAGAADLVALLPHITVLILDEVQFTPQPIQDAVLTGLLDFRSKSGWIVACGLRFSSLRTPFPFTKALLAHADVQIELVSSCAVCGAKRARYGQRLVDGRPVSANASLFLSPSPHVRYEPRCVHCHQLEKDDKLGSVGALSGLTSPESYPMEFP